MSAFTLFVRESQGTHKRLQRRLAVMFAQLLGVSLLVTAWGCGGPKAEERLKTHLVEGKVTVNGRPEAGVRVTLAPKDKSNSKLRPAQAVTEKDGSFKLSTYVANDGAIEGDYAVTLVYLKLVDNGGGSAPGPNVLPVKYSKESTTDISFQVKPGANTIPAIDIK